MTSNTRKFIAEGNFILASQVEYVLRAKLKNSTLHEVINLVKDEGGFVSPDGQFRVEDTEYRGMQQGENPEPTILRFDPCNGVQIVNGSNSQFFMLEYAQFVMTGKSGCIDICFLLSLAQKLGLLGGWNASITESGWSNIIAPVEQVSGLNLIPVYSYQRSLVYYLEIQNDVDGNYSVLPVSFFSHPRYRRLLKLYIPPKPPYIMLNSEKLAQFPNATVTITTDIPYALNFCHNDTQIVLGNPGGVDWSGNLDIACLHGRKVELLTNQPPVSVGSNNLQSGSINYHRNMALPEPPNFKQEMAKGMKNVSKKPTQLPKM